MKSIIELGIKQCIGQYILSGTCEDSISSDWEEDNQNE